MLPVCRDTSTPHLINKLTQALDAVGMLDGIRIVGPITHDTAYLYTNRETGAARTPA